MDAPPVLTPERIDAMLSVMAEVCFASMVEAGERQKAAEDIDQFDRSGRTLQRACRNLRQTIAMKQRFDREEARKAADARRCAEDDRLQAGRLRREAVGARRGRVLRHFERVLWDEYEDDEAHERLEDLDARLTDLADDPDFLDTPVETLIQRLADEIERDESTISQPPCGEGPGVGVSPASSSADLSTLQPSGGTAEPPPPDPEPPPQLHAEPPPEAAPATPELPPPAPPDPPPYVPPWEKLRPGQVMPGGGTGW
jgi:hypothetical protein